MFLLQKYQFTMYAEKYKPVSCIVDAENRMDFALGKEPFRRAIQKICAKRCWTYEELMANGYTKWKVRKVEA